MTRSQDRRSQKSPPKRGADGRQRPGENSRPPRPPRRRLTRAQKTILAAFGVLIAILLAGGFELALRAVGYGPDLRLFLPKQIKGEPWWELNRQISLRYFPPSMVKEPGFERFPAAKSPDSYRVFSMGASSTIGDPFGTQASYSAFLREMLADLHPERDIEVVNCGIVAISSLNVLDLIPDVLRHEPDAILLYTGHNEAYGADAVLSGLRGTIGNRSLLKARMRLRNTRIGHLVQDLAPRFARKRGGPAKEFGMDLMEGKVLPHDGALHGQMLAIYEANLEEMIRTANRRGVDVILCTLASNVRDQSPMGSAHGKGFSRKADWEASFRAGADAMATRAWDVALGHLRAAAALDSSHAETRFRIARCLDALAREVTDDGARAQRIAEARAHYLAARDLDTVHFRACSDQNRIVRDVAARLANPHLVLVDIERDLEEISPDGIPGREVMTEHVHPFIWGHAFIAERICRTLAETPAGARIGRWNWERVDSREAYTARLGLSDADEAAGLHVTVRYKLSKWPFTQAYENRAVIAWLNERIREQTRDLDPIAAQVFAELQSGRMPLAYDYGTRHQEIARRALTAQEVPLAIREFQLCERYWGPNAEVTVNLAQAHLLASMIAPTDSLLELATLLDPDLPRIRFVRGMLRRAQGRFGEAREEFAAYLRVEPTGVYAQAARQLLAQMGR